MWHLPREVPGHCDVQSGSARGASSWAQTGTHRQSVDVRSLVTYPERGSRGKREARPKAGTGEKADVTAVPTSYSGASKLSDTSVPWGLILTMAFAKQTSLTLTRSRGL